MCEPGPMPENYYSSPQFFEAVVDAIPALVFIKDETFRFVFVNQALATLFNKPKATILGKTDADLISDKDQVASFNNADRTVLLCKEQIKISEEFLNDAQGKRHVLATIKTPLLLPNGKIHILGIATDITDIPRTSEIDKLRFSIIADMAHIVNTPVSEVSINITALSSEIDRYRQRSWCGYGRFHFSAANRNMNAIKSAILSIRTTSRTFAAIAQLNYCNTEARTPEKHRIEGIITDILTQIRALLPLDTVSFNVPSNAQGMQITLDQTDVSLVRTVLYNIIHNAYKFSKQDSPISITLHRHEAHATIAIQDHGVGIAPDDLQRIFEPGFTRRAASHSPGTGMGLTVAREICKRLKWTISVKSDLDCGTTVSLDLPIHDSQDKQ